MATDNAVAEREAAERAVRQAHGFHDLRVKDVVDETIDAKSFVLEIPEDLTARFAYRSGQFCTFRVRTGGDELLRSYSMSSAPETDPELTVTVKRVPGGTVSNWFLDQVHPGSVLEATAPAGVFCLEERGTEPVVAFCGGSGVTPVMALVKTTLTTTERPVRVLYANRSPESVIFHETLADLQDRYGDRLVVRHHFDSESGYVSEEQVRDLAGSSAPGDVYICGPEPFMDLVETTLLAGGTSPERIFIERFGTGSGPPIVDGADVADAAVPETGADAPSEVTVILKGKKSRVSYKQGDTVLETARRAGLNPPFSCESGTCATCMAILRDGTATMRVNHALTDEEVEEGWILTCQSLPTSPTTVVEYESY